MPACDPRAALPERPRRRARFALPRRYVVGLGAEIASFAFMVLAGIEAIYLSDKVITDLLHTTLQNQADFSDLALLILYATPEVLFIAFPSALLIAVYLVLLHRREAREFIVFAGVGYGTASLVALALLIGLLAQALSLTVSGFIEPHSRHLFAKTAFETRYKALREGRLATGKFYVFGDYAVFAPLRPGEDVVDNVFIHRRLEGNRYRIMIADRATLFGSPEIRNLGLIFENVTAHDFLKARPPAGDGESGETTCADCRNTRPAAPFNVVNVNRLYGELPTSDTPEFGPRGRRVVELTTAELIANPSRGEEAAREIASRVVRSLVALLAPLLAVLAMALTRPATLFFALPAACAIVLGAGFFGGEAAAMLAGAGALAASAAAAGAALLAALILIVLIRRIEHGCVRPEGVRL